MTRVYGKEDAIIITVHFKDRHYDEVRKAVIIA